MDLEQAILKRIRESAESVISAASQAIKIEQVARIIYDLTWGDKKVLIFGNGGSAADAQHFAAELVGRFETERMPIHAFSLSTDTSILTAIGNDYGFDEVFARQVRAHARPSDILIGISTSGNSENVRRALAIGHDIGTTNVLLTKRNSGKLTPCEEFADITLSTLAQRTCNVQEGHIVMIHAICFAVDRLLEAEGKE